MKIIVVLSLAVCVPVAVTLADPHGGVLAAVPLATHQWPGSVGPYHQSTCFGCRPVGLAVLPGRKRRSAEPHLGAAYAFPRRLLTPITPYGDLADPHAYLAPSVHGHAVVTRPDHFRHHKRSADPHGYGYGVGLHPGYATSYVGPTTYGYPHAHSYVHSHYKRSADPHGYGYGVGLHPGYATSYVGPTTYGYPHAHRYVHSHY